MCADAIGRRRPAPINRPASATMRIAMAAPSPRLPAAIARSSSVSVTLTDVVYCDLKADPEAEIELPARARTVERAHGADLERQAAGVHAQPGTDAANRMTTVPGSRLPVPGHDSAIGKEKRVDGDDAVLQLSRPDAQERESHFQVADQQPVAQQLVAAHLGRIRGAVAKVIAMTAHEITRSEVAG